MPVMTTDEVDPCLPASPGYFRFNRRGKAGRSEAHAENPLGTESVFGDWLTNY